MQGARRKGFVLTVLAAAFTVWLPVTPAQDWYVDVNFAGCATGDGSPGNPFCLIMDAVHAAADGDVIHIAPGVYLENLDLAKDLTLFQDPPGAVTVDGQNLGSTVMVTSQSQVVLDGLTVTNGQALSGGGIFLDDASDLTLTNCTITGNQARLAAPYRGGGIYASGSSTLTIVDSAILSNSATYDGGGIAVKGASLFLRSVVLDGNGGNLGGGLQVDNGNLFGLKVDVQDTLFQGNWGRDGGGIYVTSGTVTLTNTTLSGNQTSDSYYPTDAGGIFNAGKLTATDCYITGNVAQDGNGGGIQNSGSMTLLGSTVSRNESGTGAGIYNTGTLSMTNCTVSNHTIAGGIRNRAGVATLTHCTVTANSNNYGGGLQLDAGSTTYLDQTIVAGNTASSTGPDCLGTVTSRGYILIGDTTDCTVLGDLTGSLLGVDPKLGILRSDAGPTPTHPLGADSPAIDAGNPAPSQSPATDQRGVPRRSPDIGAVEFGLALDIDPNVAPVNDPLSISTGPGAPGSLYALFLVEVDGASLFFLVAVGQLDGAGQAVIPAGVPPVLQGTVTRFQSFGFDPTDGSLVASNPEFLRVSG